MAAPGAGVEIIVLAKVVPDADTARFDPMTRTLRRDAGALFLNPFDQRALRAAIEMRREGDRVTVVSMGPPTVESAIAETLGLGADHAILVSDPALAGSDTLVTANVLARVLERRDSGFVVAGQWSTDSETGQMPAELAERLGLPLVRSARRLVRSPEGTGLEAIVDTDDGTATVSVAGPAVVTVGEKIGKPLRPGDAHRASPQPAQLERLDLAALGLAPEEVGLAGSPTMVVGVSDRTPRRAGLRFGEGDVADRVVRALTALRAVLEPGAPGPDLASPRVVGEGRGILAILASDERGALDPSVPSLIDHAKRGLPSRRRIALWASPEPPSDEARTSLDGVERVRGFSAAIGWTARTAATALSTWVSETDGLDALLLPATAFGREVAGRMAAALDLGLVGDAIEIAEGTDGEIVCEKPSFGGGTIAEIRTRTMPVLATVRAERSPPSSGTLGSTPPWDVVGTVRSDPTTRWSARARDADDGLPDPDVASVVVSVGVGASSPAAIAAVRRAALAWHAGLVGTRRVVDAGVLSVRRQVGLTGRSIAADLGVLVGVRGSPNHLVGWRRTRALLAINPDVTAPVFDGADVGIVGSWEEVLPLLEPELLRIVRRT
jgi:electron transfer flavoprotein alpha subunit